MRNLVRYCNEINSNLHDESESVLQVDACHVYHMPRSRGVPAEIIIHIMPDDIANNPSQVLNVNLANFMKILKRDKELAKKGKKVLTAGPEDHVLV
uniref:Uncharacterized protein n=1 Tax=Tetranychus urticae TaxID=32264 RepID=T1JRG1_TETUR